MNQAFDYNGRVVAPSVSKPVLRTTKKTISIDAADRDDTKYYTNGDWVAYLPRTYTNVVSIRLKSATFLNHNAIQTTIADRGLRAHPYSSGQNIPSSTQYNNDTIATLEKYLFIDIEGLNKCDECAVGGNRSGFPDGYFAKIPLTKELIVNAGSSHSITGYSVGSYINYNDSSEEENIGKYSPPISNLDRLHIRTRVHSQQGNRGFVYWTSDGDYAKDNNRNNIASYTLTLEIEYLENGFDDFSSFETRVR